jgi:hypothetical protein
MAAYVSKVNGTEFCIKAQSAVAGRAYQDDARVSATLADPSVDTQNRPLMDT